MEILLDPAIIVSFLTLTALEIVLGIDNLILISILTDKLPKAQQPLARKVGIMAAVVTRLLLLSLIFAMTHLTFTLFTMFGLEFSVRELLLIIGGIFLLMKATLEIHHKLEDAGHKDQAGAALTASFSVVVGQIVVMDVVFSFDSVLTAVGIADHLWVMVTAILMSVLFMLVAMEAVHKFIAKHPTVKVLALSYMMLIGMALVAEGFHQEIPKGYLYFAMAFSFGVEVVNMMIRSKAAREGHTH